MPNIAPTNRLRAAYAPVRSRLANRRSGVIGCSARRSLATKNASRRAPAVNGATVSRSVQPAVPAWTIPKTTAVIPSVDVAAPARSKRPVGVPSPAGSAGRRGSGRSRSAR